MASKPTKRDQKAKTRSRGRKVELSDLQVPKGGAVKGGATDIFLKLADIKGESLDDKHKDEIDLQTTSWDPSTGGTGGMGS